MSMLSFRATTTCGYTAYSWCSFTLVQHDWLYICLGTFCCISNILLSATCPGRTINPAMLDQLYVIDANGSSNLNFLSAHD